MNTVQDIYNATIDNGGATYSLSTGAPVSTGYAVGNGSSPLATTLPARDLTRGDLEQFVEQCKAVGLDVVGTWVNRGTVYLEPTTIVQDYEGAVTLGIMRGEMAIYDMGTGREIDLSHVQLLSAGGAQNGEGY